MKLDRLPTLPTNLIHATNYHAAVTAPPLAPKSIAKELKLQSIKDLNKNNIDDRSRKGLFSALTIISVWAIGLIVFLSFDLAEIPRWVIPIAILWQTFLYTGLFITAHDAMHRALYPKNPRVNDTLGAIVTFLYGFFPYKQLLKNHQQHHLHPASQSDPDFYHHEQCQHPVLWYLEFMLRYFSWRQLLGTQVAFYGAAFLLHISPVTLLLFWVLPSLLSSMQLFYFGTYLPHREPATGYTNCHRTQSNSLSPFWSFLTCYHFGYHEEHHEYPAVAWWQLPLVRQYRLAHRQ